MRERGDGAGAYRRDGEGGIMKPDDDEGRTLTPEEYRDPETLLKILNVIEDEQHREFSEWWANRKIPEDELEFLKAVKRYMPTDFIGLKNHEAVPLKLKEKHFG